MILSPLQAAERIAKSEDRLRAYIFFLFFSRFEYALKRAGFVGASDEAKADWEKVARQYPRLLAELTDGRFRAAIDYLRDSPPKKQIVSNGRLAWETDRYTGLFDIGRVLTLVCRIRNNLFHGGKFPEGPEDDTSRDRELLDAGLTVLQACLDADEHLRRYFLEEFR